MIEFTHQIPTKIIFGPDKLGQLGTELAAFGKKVLVVYGGGSIKRNGIFDKAVASMQEAGLTWFEQGGVEPNPKVTSVQAGADLCKKEGIDVILAIGGGSVIDCAKGIAAAAFYDGDAWDLPTHKAPIGKCLPIVSILTLAATGSEMDPVGVISNKDTEQKLVISDPALRPAVSFLDPTLTYSVSAFQTASGSADILSHIMEDYFVDGDGSMYMLDRIKEGMMKTVIHYAPIAIADPTNYEASANLMWTSSWAINGFTGALCNCEWTNHMIEHELSAIYDITHGLGLAIVTPRWMRYVLDDTTAPKMKEFAVNVFGVDASLPDKEAALKGIECLEDFFFNKLGLKSTLTEIGIGEENLEVMAKKACNGKETLNGWRVLTPAQIVEILKACL